MLTENLIMILPIKWAFRKTERGRELNVTEIFYALAFIGCMELILAMLVTPVGTIFGINVSTGLSFASMLIYLCVYHQLFEISWWRSIKLSMLVALLVVLEIVVLVFLIGVVVGIVAAIKGVGDAN